MDDRVDRRATLTYVDEVDGNLVKVTEDYHALCNKVNESVRRVNEIDSREPSEEWGTWFDSRASQLLLLVTVAYGDSTEGRRILSFLRLAALFARFSLTTFTEK